MPNWCNNQLTLSHDNPEMITRAVAAFKDGSFLQEFVPMPAELEGTKAPGDTPNWYDWRIANWGTKWDVGGGDGDIHAALPNAATFCFESAWAPPFVVYPELEDLGFKVTAYWFEPGVAFAGRFVDGECDDYELKSKEDLAAIPEDLDEAMNIRESLEEGEEE